MNRATIVYMIMLVACVVGGWIVLSIGDRLVAPDDLAGKWTLAPQPGQQIAAQSQNIGMTVEQSGTFFQIAFDKGPRVNLQLSTPSTPSANSPHTLLLVGEPWRLTTEGPIADEEMPINLQGPDPAYCGRWMAKRIVRTFPITPMPTGAH